MANKHTFHIPVMGIGFTLDSAIKVAPFGIDSVMSLSGQTLFEKLRKHYCKENLIDYQKIGDEVYDHKAKRITAFLNLVNALVTKSIDNYTKSTELYRNEIEKYLGLLPNGEDLKTDFRGIMQDQIKDDERVDWIENNITPGKIDVNIMTKLDKVNYKDGERLPEEYNDAHVALRGYANSDLSSSLILSAGLNPKLFSYIAEFDDFYPDESGNIKKGIILKVSDYRSAYIQGRFLANRGVWVSEYRIESGLNCGGHAFATEGYLMGPILEEFREKRKELFEAMYELFIAAIQTRKRFVEKDKLSIRYSAQGGVGTSEEHEFLLDTYELDSVGWGSPFLLVPEATSVDEETMERIIHAREKDFYLSNTSPLGIPFNNLRGTSKEIKSKLRLIDGKPGSPCIHGYLALSNTEFSDKPICTASRQYQEKKLEELSKSHLDNEVYRKKYNQIVEKLCICSGLVNSLLMINKMDVPKGTEGVSICPGPNMYYFKKRLTLQEMVDHIYGRRKINFNENRPHMFIKELSIYIGYLSSLVKESSASLTNKAQKRLLTFSDNLFKGIQYYQTLFKADSETYQPYNQGLLKELDHSILELQDIRRSILSCSTDVVIV